ncbi:hypothetical protein Pint_12273 [Pistacia integerrima]|uniref:Uncharacterized protein n=1 Tax=Pistacia integerrima TaxID=434235 RepID=A0ACC0XHV3_9ROSI|nr:hypothetical protein Pint_12273 [Pistacia integerrima]
MSLIAGSYEKFIWGYKLKPLKNSSSSSTLTLTLTQLFSYPSHLAPITTVAVAGTAGASGSSDDTIHLYDLSSSASLGALHLQDSSSVTSLAFYTPPNLSVPRNLFAASADGFVSIFDADPFVLLKSVKAHKKGVNDLAVHPSGKLALSVERDECLAMEKIGVHQAEDAKLLCELEGNKRVLCAAPGENDGGGGGDADDPYLVASASSDGVIHVWNVRMAVKEKPIPLAEAKTNSGLTCLAGSSIKFLRCSCHVNNETIFPRSSLTASSSSTLWHVGIRFSLGESVGSPIVKVTDPEEAELFFVLVFSSLSLIMNNGGGPAPEGGARQYSENEMQEELVEWLEKQDIGGGTID